MKYYIYIILTITILTLLTLSNCNVIFISQTVVCSSENPDMLVS